MLALLDVASGTAVWTAVGGAALSVTLDLHVDYLGSPRRGCRVVALVECYHLEDTLAFVRGHAHDGDPDRPIASLGRPLFLFKGGLTNVRLYDRFLGVAVAEQPGEAPLYAMAFGDHVEGRSGYLHGGAIAGLLEVAAYAALEHALRDERSRRAKPIGVSVEYMRHGLVKLTHAQGRVIRIGRRIANVAVEAWQDDPSRPIAAGRMRYSLRG